MDKEIKKLFRSYRFSFPAPVYSREHSDQQAMIRVFHGFMRRGGDLDYVRNLVKGYEQGIIDHTTYLDFENDVCPLHHKKFVEYIPGSRRCLCEDCNWEEANSVVPEGAWT